MKWLEQAPRVDTALSFGRPWPQGHLAAGDVGRLVLGDADTLHEARPLAFWPDGSIKWTAHAAVVTEGQDAEGLEPRLDPRHAGHAGANNPAAESLARPALDGVQVDTGVFTVTIPGSGSELTGPLLGPDGRELARGLRLVVSAPDAQVAVASAEVETPGVVRSVVKVQGTVSAGSVELLRFIVRLTFFAGRPTLDITQTILYQDAAKDRVIKGLGLRLDRALQGDLLNRRVSIAGDAAVYTEPVQSL
jgi:hypothetical protein